MKMSFIGLLVLFSISAFADSSNIQSQDQDPAIKLIRYKLKVGQQPTVSQLKIGKSWECQQFVAGKRGWYEGVRKNFFKFERYAGLIQNAGDADVSHFVFNGSSLVGKTSIDGNYVIRVTTKGDLVVEETNEDDFGESYNYVDDAISNNSVYAIRYFICPVNKVK